MSIDEETNGRWLPSVVSSRSPQPQYCQLVIKMTVRRGKGGFIVLDNILSLGTLNTNTVYQDRDTNV